LTYPNFWDTDNLGKKKSGLVGGEQSHQPRDDDCSKFANQILPSNLLSKTLNLFC
jgi:hypothetical protein